MISLALLLALAFTRNKIGDHRPNALCALLLLLELGKGEVSSVTWLPGFGSLVIVDHQNGFRSVYANLATVSVRQGTAVQQGAVVGTSGENIDGALVHFELWYGRDRLNPATYLR